MAAVSYSIGNILSATADVMLVRGIPEHIRSDNGPEMTAKVVRGWLAGDRLGRTYSGTTSKAMVMRF